MITLQELCSYLDQLLQPGLYPDHCPNGLQVEGKKEIARMATAVTASLATIEAAIDMNADALIVHHGLFWNRDSYVISGTKRKKLELLLNKGVSLIAYHLPLDANKEVGNNWRAAKELGWRELEPFGIYNGTAIGVKGVFDVQSRDEFAKGLEVYYGHQAHAAPGGRQLVKSAALISGGAHKSLVEAAESGVDCFVTGSFDEPAWHQAYEEGVNFFALGHSNTERVGPRSLALQLEERFGLPVAFVDVENPF